MVANIIKSKYIIVKNNKIEKLFSNCILGPFSQSGQFG